MLKALKLKAKAAGAGELHNQYTSVIAEIRINRWMIGFNIVVNIACLILLK